MRDKKPRGSGFLRSLEGCVLLLLSWAVVECVLATELNSPHAKELTAVAKKTGVVRVVVTIALDATQDGGKQTIVDARDGLFLKLKPFRVKTLKQYQTLPILVLEIGPAALDFLLSSRFVVSVEPDILSHTMGMPASGRMQVDK